MKKTTFVRKYKNFEKTFSLRTFSSSSRLLVTISFLSAPAHIFPPTTPTPSHRLLMTGSSVRVLGALALAASLSVATAARPVTTRALLESLTGAELRTNCGTATSVKRTSCDAVWTDTFYDACLATTTWVDAQAADVTWADGETVKSVELAADEAQDAIDQIATGRGKKEKKPSPLPSCATSTTRLMNPVS